MPFAAREVKVGEDGFGSIIRGIWKKPVSHGKGKSKVTAGGVKLLGVVERLTGDSAKSREPISDITAN